MAGPAAWLLVDAAPAGAGSLPEPPAAPPPAHDRAEAADDRRGLVRGPRLRMEARAARLADLRRTPRPSPRVLVVPRAGVRARVVPVGVERGTRALELPAAGGQLGWYRHGPSPGQPGTAVIAGHVDWADAPGAFFELRRLRPGDRVRVRLPGRVRAFEVVARRRYGKDELPPRLFARSGPPLLALVTCAGRES